jgi:hypothetical protein
MMVDESQSVENPTPEQEQAPEDQRPAPRFACGMQLLMPLHGEPVQIMAIPAGPQFERAPTQADFHSMLAQCSDGLRASIMVSTLRQAEQQERMQRIAQAENAKAIADNGKHRGPRMNIPGWLRGSR